MKKRNIYKGESLEKGGESKKLSVQWTLKAFLANRQAFPTINFTPYPLLSHFPPLTLTLTLPQPNLLSFTLSLSHTCTDTTTIYRRRKLLPEYAKEGVRKRMRVSMFVCLIQAKFQQFLFFFMRRRMDEQEREFVDAAFFLSFTQKDQGTHWHCKRS